MLTNVVNCILLIKLKKKNRFCPLETRIFDSEHLLISWREVILEKRLSCLIQHDPLFSLLYKKYHLQKITIFACNTPLRYTISFKEFFSCAAKYCSSKSIYWFLLRNEGLASKCVVLQEALLWKLYRNNPHHILTKLCWYCQTRIA
jgi:hypothetical protein